MNLSNYGTKSDLKRIICINTSKFAKKADLNILKSKIDQIDVNKVKTVPNNLTKLSDVVKMRLLKILHMINRSRKVDTVDSNKQNKTSTSKEKQVFIK